MKNKVAVESLWYYRAEYFAGVGERKAIWDAVLLPDGNVIALLGEDKRNKDTGSVTRR